MKFFVIKHLPSGGYLPERYGRAGRGHTFSEPSLELQPRLFASERSATIALTYWLKGHFNCNRGQDCDGDYYEDLTIVPQVHRVRDHMRVVPINIVEAG